jgi:hypothetical protein
MPLRRIALYVAIAFVAFVALSMLYRLATGVSSDELEDVGGAALVTRR